MQTPTENTYPRVTAFTDTYLPTVNGVTYTVQTWRDSWRDSGGEMNIVYPESDHEPEVDGEYSVPSIPFSFYDGYRAAPPVLPTPLKSQSTDIVHAHTLYALGLAAVRYARRTDAPLVASYHTPIGEYVDYVVPDALSGLAERCVEAYERRFLNAADAVVTPSKDTQDYLEHNLGVTTDVEVIPNGIDTDFFRPADADPFVASNNLPDGPLVGYTGRHGHEKCVDHIFDAVDELEADATVVLGGDGPARDALETRAAQCDADVRFLGFLDRDELPAFYSALDVFAFPSPIETEGLVARESMACGTPVVGADEGALRTTIENGVTGYHYPHGDNNAFGQSINRALQHADELSEACLAHRDEWSIDRTMTRVHDLYTRLTEHA